MNGLDFLLNINSAKIKFGLERTSFLLESCNNPHKKIFSIQIAGTNGKGSTAAIISNVLIKNGYRVGLFTSPHLVAMNERIQINNQLISNSFINQFINQYHSDIVKIGASYFEIFSVMAMEYFLQNNVDIAILETGLGGKLDSVSAMENSGLIFTTISYDHMHILGNTIEKITLEKAGAIKKSNNFIISTKQELKVVDILNLEADKKQKNIEYVQQIKDNKLKHLKGAHQNQNATLAKFALSKISTLFKFKIDKASLHISNTFWPGRLQTIQTKPFVVFDVGHNAQGIVAIYDYFKCLIQRYNKKTLIVGFESTKEIIKEVSRLSALFDEVIFTETGIKNSMSAKQMSQQIKHPNIFVNLKLNQLLLQVHGQMGKNDMLLILGSHYFGESIDKLFKNCFDNHSNMS